MALKLYKNNVVGGEPEYLYVDDLIPPVGFTATDDPVDWDDSFFKLRQTQDEILPLFTEWRELLQAGYLAVPVPITAQTEAASKWFVVDKAVRDTVMTAAQQEAEARRFSNYLIIESQEETVEHWKDLIKDADLVALDPEVILQSKVKGIRTLTYVGDGTVAQAITGVGFKPKYARIIEEQTSDNSKYYDFETSDSIAILIAGGAVIRKTNNAAFRYKDNMFVSFDDDGITVGDDSTNAHPNKNNTTYHVILIG